jgi:Protein of unknown function (DUF3300)
METPTGPEKSRSFANGTVSRREPSAAKGRKSTVLIFNRRIPGQVSAVPILLAALLSVPVFAQTPAYPQQSAPDPQQPQYPQQAPNYPQAGQYPQDQQPQYPQQPYPPQQYPQQQYPQQQQQSYPPQQQYPQQPAPYPQAGQYPQQPAPYPQQAPPYFPPAELDRLVSRIALYPDALLAQVMAAATYWDQIPQAAGWADQHHYLTGDALAAAISADQLPWDPSVQALLPFPNVLDMMASDPSWTHELGDAFLAQQPEVMDAVQRERQTAYRYGYLRSNPQILVTNGPYIAIAPVNPGFIVVPYYNPAVVFFPPRPGFFVGGAIGFNFGISLGVAFRPWGWGFGFNRLDWAGHAVFVNNARWGRSWVNRASYVHPYAAELRHAGPAFRPGGLARPGGYAAARPAESHELRPRNTQERQAWQNGRARQEEHKTEERR